MDFSFCVICVGPAEPTVWIASTLEALVYIIAVSAVRKALRRQGRSRPTVIATTSAFLVGLYPVLGLGQCLLTSLLYGLLYRPSCSVTVCTAFVHGNFLAPFLLASGIAVVSLGKHTTRLARTA